MKKIFAIALALVMVLSMASAFATYCNWGAWDCATTSIKCGKATVEVVPYVRSSSACGFEFVGSDCAVAMKGENIYFAVKVTVDADVNQDWWTAAKFNLKTTDVEGAVNLNWDLPAWKDVKNGGTFWLYATGTNVNDAKKLAATLPAGWEKEDSSFTFGEKNVFSAKAAKSSAKVCATLKSEWSIGTQEQYGDEEVAYTWWHDTGVSNPARSLTIGKYDVDFRGAPEATDGGVKQIHVKSGDKDARIYLDKDDKVDFVYVSVDGGANFVKMTGYTNLSAVAFESAESKEYSFTCNEGAYLKEVFDFLKVDFDTCMTNAGITNNFGWKDEVKSCTNYKTEGQAVVNAECVVAIPKTGDASVLAWLF